MSGNASLTRRDALAMLAISGSGSPLRSQELAGEPPGRIAPLAELVNVFEMQAMARRKLADHVYTTVSGTNRAALERITFRPRLMVNVSKLDLSLDLFGSKLFAPIIVGPVWQQEVFHPEGELATVRGASAANSLVIVSGRSSKPISQIVAAAKTPVWYQAYPDSDLQNTIQACREAVKAGCKAVCLTVGVPYQTRGSSGSRPQPAASLKTTWEQVTEIRKNVTAPLLLKGILSPEEAVMAVKHGVQAIVVSNHGGLFTPGFADPMEMLPAVAEAVGGKIPILIDGSFRRGTDILKALALGARAVLVARPPIWGLAAYGAEGVQTVLEMLQTELARAMAMCGKPSLGSIDRNLVKIHRR